jgi:hypothetical protein
MRKQLVKKHFLSKHVGRSGIIFRLFSLILAGVDFCVKIWPGLAKHGGGRVKKNEGGGEKIITQEKNQGAKLGHVGRCLWCVHFGANLAPNLDKTRAGFVWILGVLF